MTKEKKQKLKSKLGLWLPPVIWALIIFAFSSMRTNAVSVVYWQEFVFKKSIHIAEYGIFTLLIYRGLRGEGKSKKESAIISVLFAVVYGASDEFHQSFTPGREPTLRDVIFDTIGALLIILVIWKLLPKAPKKLRSLAEKYQVT